MKMIKIKSVISYLETNVSNIEDSQLKADLESNISDLHECVKQIENALIKIDRAKDDIQDTVY